MEIKPKDYLANAPCYWDNAPCYWDVGDDGALWECQSCWQRSHASEMIGVLTPNGKFSIDHRECIDEDWLKNATHMSGKL